MGGGSFTYTTDWSGFNIPSEDLEKTYDTNKPPDWNRCDHLVYGIYRYLKCKEAGDKFYIIATTEDDDDTFEHEFSHALYEMNSSYKKEMDKNIANLPEEDLKEIHRILKEVMGYGDQVHQTEIQAYFSTGLDISFGRKFNKYQKPFQATYKKFRQKYLT